MVTIKSDRALRSREELSDPHDMMAFITFAGTLGDEDEGELIPSGT
jgi:hypothetical protein